MKPRVLHVITVYNGRSFVFRAIESALAMSKDVAEIDVLVLDDASPEPGFSQDVESFCTQHGAQYYLTPRNLGIPRNVSLGLLTAVEKHYDYVTINNSDVIFPKNLVTTLIGCLGNDNVGSVTAWSNNVSIYTIANEDPDQHLANQETVDFVSQTMADKYGTSVLDVPAGISFCIMMPVSVVKHVGVMDPIFGRGYCEETDWSLRSLRMGYRVCLAPGTFVYHMGRGSNLEAGLVSGAHSTVPENEVIIDKRYPTFRADVEVFMTSGVMDELRTEAVRHLTKTAAARFGYDVAPTWSQPSQDVRPVQLKVNPAGHFPALHLTYAGFSDIRPLETPEAIGSLIEEIGLPPTRDHYTLASTGAPAQAETHEDVSYPASVW